MGTETPFSLFPSLRGRANWQETGLGCGYRVGSGEKKPWMRRFGAALAHSLQQGLILGHGGGQSRLRSHQEGEGSWQEPVQLSLRSGGGWMSSPRQGRVLHLSGAVVTLPEEGPISCGPFSCREEIPWDLPGRDPVKGMLGVFSHRSCFRTSCS